MRGMALDVLPRELRYLSNAHEPTIAAVRRTLRKKPRLARDQSELPRQDLPDPQAGWSFDDLLTAVRSGKLGRDDLEKLMAAQEDQEMKTNGTDPLEKFREHLRGEGMDKSIEVACDIARGLRDSNGDELPKNALAGGMGGAARSRLGNSGSAGALDQFPDAARIGVVGDYRPDPSRLDPPRSHKSRLARLDREFGIGRIETGEGRL